MEKANFISISPPSTSFWVRGPRATSRTGAIIHRILRSPRAELVFGVSVVLTLLTLWGSNAAGQGSLVTTWAHDYVEETALAFGVLHPISSLQLADMNSFYAGNAGRGTEQTPSPTKNVATVLDSALIALAPPDDNYISELAVHSNEIVQYTVQEGDLLSFIASDFGVSQDSIIWANNLKNADSISPDQILRIPPVSGVIYVAKSGDTAGVVAKKYGSSEDQIIAFNHLPKDGAIRSGDQLIIPNGHQPVVAQINPSATTIDTKIKRVGTYTQAGSILTALKFSYLPDLGDYFMQPTSGRNGRILHLRNGIDVASSCGTPIYASADGTVAIADAMGWNGGFGKYIKITHPNGTETLYAHASKLLASIGQAVAKGQKIALMGSTGQSTGCHLHFEVHGAKNPLATY